MTAVLAIGLGSTEAARNAAKDLWLDHPDHGPSLVQIRAEHMFQPLYDASNTTDSTCSTR